VGRAVVLGMEAAMKILLMGMGRGAAGQTTARRRASASWTRRIFTGRNDEEGTRREDFKTRATKRRDAREEEEDCEVGEATGNKLPQPAI
jgi:hypothetical protein